MIKYEHLVGIPFEHGKNDCYELGRKFFFDNFGIELTNYARPDNWWETDLNLYYDHFRREGFEVVNVPLPEIRIADCFLMSIMTEQPCHSGIYVGNNQMLHHFMNRFSKVDSYKGIWRNATVAIIRHKDVPEIIPDYEKIDVLDLMTPHKRKRYAG